MTDRDPRTDPRRGDALTHNVSGVRRVVVEVDPYEGVTYTSSNIREVGPQRATITAWREWCARATIQAIDGRAVK